jgi:bisphosphoglycerate-independent phosphoglycerate mutase (AlkP superfamily)
MNEKLTVLQTGIGKSIHFKVINDKYINNQIQEVTNYDVTVSLTCTCKHGSIHPNKMCKHLKAVLIKLME